MLKLHLGYGPSLAGGLRIKLDHPGIFNVHQNRGIFGLTLIIVSFVVSQRYSYSVVSFLLYTTASVGTHSEQATKAK